MQRQLIKMDFEMLLCFYKSLFLFPVFNVVLDLYFVLFLDLFLFLLSNLDRSQIFCPSKWSLNCYVFICKFIITTNNIRIFSSYAQIELAIIDAKTIDKNGLWNILSYATKLPICSSIYGHNCPIGRKIGLLMKLIIIIGNLIDYHGPWFIIVPLHFSRYYPFFI